MKVEQIPEIKVGFGLPAAARLAVGADRLAQGLHQGKQLQNRIVYFCGKFLGPVQGLMMTLKEVAQSLVGFSPQLL